jgi:hypothetical protein
MNPEDREFAIELRRHLVSIVGLLERYASIEPVCRRCAGCPQCESMHRRENDVNFAVKRAGESIPIAARN